MTKIQCVSFLLVMIFSILTSCKSSSSNELNISWKGTQAFDQQVSRFNVSIEDAKDLLIKNKINQQVTVIRQKKMQGFEEGIRGNPFLKFIDTHEKEVVSIPLSLESRLIKASPRIIVGDFYVFSEPIKARYPFMINLRGYYVNGYTGEIVYRDGIEEYKVVDRNGKFYDQQFKKIGKTP